jgi:hypothetical protein
MTRDALTGSPRAAAALALAAAAITCAGSNPDPGAARLAALTAGAAADVLSDLAAVDDPDAAGVRDAFHAANVTALENARLAHDSAPRATRSAYALSLEAAETAGTFADALGAAIEARDELAARSREARAAREAADLLAEIVRRRADIPRLEAEANRLERETSRLRETYDSWHADNPYDGSEEWSTESTRRLKSRREALDAWEAAGAEMEENGEALLRALLGYLNLTLTDRAGESALSDLADSAGPATVGRVKAEAQTLAKAEAVALEDALAKVRAAEDWHPTATAAYRAAATGWRALLEAEPRQ